MDYLIIEGNSAEELELLVMDALNTGYTLVGGMIPCVNGAKITYTQTVYSDTASPHIVWADLTD